MQNEQNHTWLEKSRFILEGPAITFPIYYIPLLTCLISLHALTSQTLITLIPDSNTGLERFGIS